MKLNADDRISYVQACWDQFKFTHHVKRFGMSPAEFHMVGQWLEKEIPLPVALQGINETGGRPFSLLACDAPVQRAYDYWINAMGLIPEADGDE